MEPTAAKSRAEFGEAVWEFGPRRLLLRGEYVKMPWRVAECLQMLVEAAGQVVSKDELTKRIWGGALVEESNVAKCITELRRILDPAPVGDSYIETVTRVGYRLAVEVRLLEESVEAEEEKPQTARSLRWGRPWTIRFAAGAAGLLLLVGAGSVAYERNQRAEQSAELVRRGFRMVRRSNLAEGMRAAALFRQALDLKPGYPPAQAGLAESAARLGEESFEAALELAGEAVRRDPECGECQAVLGHILMTRGWKWAEAGTHLARSIELEPGELQRRIWSAYYLAAQNRLPEATTGAEAAIQMDRSSSSAYCALAAIHFFSGRYEDARRIAAQVTALHPANSAGYYWSSRAHMQLGNDTDAIIARVKEFGAWGGQTPEESHKIFATFEALHAKSGRAGVVNNWLNDVNRGKPKEVHRYNRAVWNMWIGEKAAALEELEAAVISRPYNIIFVAVDPAFEPLRSHPRFQAVVRAVGLIPRKS
jgi:DNA-binding winged helix-turn-helix (wHTH) protein/tetratricopeptide (TPR) repeat protein